MNFDAFFSLGIGFILITVLIAIAILILILVLIYTAAVRIPPHHRKMEPGLVFLYLIPLFHLVWAFFIVLRVSEGYKSYFDEQGRMDVGDCGKGVGLAWAICQACSLIPNINFIAGPASLVLLIIFLVKITGMKNQIPQMGY